MKIKEFLLNNWKKILFFILICICFFLTNKYIVKADTYNMNYEYYQQYYDNSGSSVTAVSTTWNESLQSYVSGNITTVANSYGAGLSISSPIPLLSNHTYSMSIYFDGLSNIALSSKNHIAIGTSLSNASSNYVNGNYLTTINYSSVSNNTILKFAFTTSSNGTFIFIPWTSTSTLSQSYVLTQISIDDLGSGGVSQSDIDNSLNNQTNIIQNSINDMSQDIQNGIKDNFNDCYSNLLNPNLVDVRGSLGFNVSNLEIGKTYVFTSSVPVGALKFASTFDQADGLEGPQNWNRFITSWQFEYTGNPYLFILNNDTMTPLTQDEVNNYHLQITEGTTIYSYTPYGKEVCQNKIDETNNQLGNLNDNITDSDSSDATNSAGNFFSGFETDTFGLTSIITAPLELIGSITSSSCSPLPLTIPYVDKPFNLPCMTTIYEEHFGNFLTIYQTITFGIVAYWVCVRIFNLVKDFKNPDHDEIEVLDL